MVVGIFFIRRQLSLPVPLLPVDLLRIPLFSLSICTSVCSFCAQMLAMVSLPFYLQTVLGRSEVETGLLLTPWPLDKHGDGSKLARSYLTERALCRIAGCFRVVHHGCGAFFPGSAARVTCGYQYYLADDLMWRWIWLVPVTQ